MNLRDPRVASRFALLLLLSVACTSAPAPSGPAETTTPPMSPGPSLSPSASPAPIGTSGRVRIQSPADGSFLVQGAYPHVDSPCRNAEQPRLTAR